MPSPLNGPPPEALLPVAEIAYQTSIDSAVREALSRQADLERTFREIDSAVVSAGESMTQTIDHTLTRALGGVVGIGIAAAAADVFRGWWIGAATTLLVLYVLAQATLGLATHRRDIQSRLRGFESVVSQRGARLADPLTKQIELWRGRTNDRVRFVRVLLLFMALVLLVAGIVAAAQTTTMNSGNGSQMEEDPVAPRSGTKEGTS